MARGPSTRSSRSSASDSRRPRHGDQSPINTSIRMPGKQDTSSLSDKGSFNYEPSHRRGSYLTGSGARTPPSNMLESVVGENEADDGDDDTPVTEVLQEIIMSIDLRSDGMLGCAFFSTVDGVLSFMSQVPMAGLDLCESLLIHTQPTTVLVSARASENLMNFLEQRYKQNQNMTNDDSPPDFILRVVPSTEFLYETACQKIVNLPFDDSTAVQAIISNGSETPLCNGLNVAIPHDADPESSHVKLMRRGLLINLDDRVSVACAGVVLTDLHRRRSTEFNPGGTTTESLFQVGSMRVFSLSDYMLINTDMLFSLQIVQSELHPNSQTWGLGASASGQKESLSLYGLFHHLACTPQGRTRLRQMFLQPTLNLDTLSQRQRTISLLSRPENDERSRQAVSILRKITNVRTAIAQLRRGVDAPSGGQSFDRGVWATLRRFAVQALKLKECAAGFSAHGIEVIQKLVESIQPISFVAVGGMINKTIDFEQSKSRQRPSVRAGVDPDLDELKRRYDGMGSFLTAVVNRVNQQLPEWACQYVRSCIFLPQLGFLMVVELDPTTGNGRYEGEGSTSERWEKLFTADGAVCYKNKYMKELDEQYGDMYCEIGDREVEVIHRLATAVITHEEALIRASDLCGDFDALLALAIGAKKYQWIEPQMTTDNVLHVEGGRHPLQELVVPTFVPNDCELLGGQLSSTDKTSWPRQRSMIVTGPNHSGKSIYLKQIAIIVYLAHIGSYVPATRATIGLTDKILTRISTRESVARTESAFSIDLRQVSRAMMCCTPRSLVIIDEFGKGTNMDDGAGLLAALLNHFFSLGHNMPRLLTATHFHEVLNNDFISLYDGVALHHMDVSTDWKASRMEDQITYLFKLIPGLCASSYGARCAALNGVPSTVVERAEAVASLLSRHEDISSACAKLTTDEQTQLELAEAVARRFVQEGMSFSTHNAWSDREMSSDASGLLDQILSM